MPDHTSAVAATALRYLGDLPNLLRRHRTSRGLTLREAAHEIGVAPGTLCTIENRQKAPRLPTVLAILTWMATTKNGDRRG